MAVASLAHGQGMPATVSQALQHARVGADAVGLYAVPVAGGAPIAAHNAGTPLNPASTMKLLTSYAALSALGPDFRWRTGAYLRGRLRGDVLEGDLVLRGGGDPKLVIEDMTAFVARMRQAGLREIRGDLLVDESMFDVPDDPPIDGDPSQPYNVSPHAMLVNFKATRVTFDPGRIVVDVRFDPPLADVVVDNRIKLIKGPCRHGAAGISVRDDGPESMTVRVAGQYSLGCGEQSVMAAVLGHRMFLHGFFKAAWTAAGGVFTGRTRLARGAARGEPWMEWVSPRTLADVVQDINKYSNNVMARQVLLQMGVQSMSPLSARAARLVPASTGNTGAPVAPSVPPAPVQVNEGDDPAVVAAQAAETAAAAPLANAGAPNAALAPASVQRTLAAPSQPVAGANPELARSALVGWLGTQRLSFPELVVENGSGLSRRERISPVHLSQLLQHAAGSRYADLFRETLPRVGYDGTMRNRLVGDPVVGHAWIKTGSLNDVRAIAGYVEASSGRWYALSMIVNDPRAELTPPALDAFIRWVYQNG